VIKAVFLDLDETLMPEEAAEEATLRATCAIAEAQTGIPSAQLAENLRRHSLELWGQGPVNNFCRATGIGPWEGLWGRFDGEGQAMAILRQWVPGYRDRAWIRCLADHGIVSEALVSCLGTMYAVERARHHIPYPETVSAVTALQARYHCLVVTNGAPDVQRDKLHISGLGRLLPEPIVSGDPDIGEGKPHPRIFLTALERAGCAPGEAVMVGDSWARDVIGARHLGLAAVWVNRSVSPQAMSAAGVPTITSLVNLTEVLERVGRTHNTPPQLLGGP